MSSSESESDSAAATVTSATPQWIAGKDTIDVFAKRPKGAHRLPHSPRTNDGRPAFPSTLEATWLEYLKDNPSRYLFEEERRQLYIGYLKNPLAPPVPPTPEQRKYFVSLKRFALETFELQSGHLYRKATTKREPLYAPTMAEAFWIAANVHSLMQHAGPRKIYGMIKELYYGITEDHVTWVGEHCSVCTMKAPNKTKPIIRPISSGYNLERVQIDLVDFRSQADGEFKWLIQIKCHFSLFVWLRPLKNKEAAGVAAVMEVWFGDNGYPRVL